MKRYAFLFAMAVAISSCSGDQGTLPTEPGGAEASPVTLQPAGIDGVQGAIVQGTLPQDLSLHSFESATEITAFVEQEVTLTSDLSVEIRLTENANVPWVFDGGSGNLPGVLPTGQTVTSHLLHFDVPGTSPRLGATGSIKFDGEIVGIIHARPTLDNTDALFGVAGTTYAGPDTRSRGLEIRDEPDRLEVSGDRRTLTATFSVAGKMDEIRVLTGAEVPTCPCQGDECPAPGGSLTTGLDARSGLLQQAADNPIDRFMEDTLRVVPFFSVADGVPIAGIQGATLCPGGDDAVILNFYAPSRQLVEGPFVLQPNGPPGLWVAREVAGFGSPNLTITAEIIEAPLGPELSISLESPFRGPALLLSSGGALNRRREEVQEWQRLVADNSLTDLQRFAQLVQFVTDRVYEGLNTASLNANSRVDEVTADLADLFMAGFRSSRRILLEGTGPKLPDGAQRITEPGQLTGFLPRFREGRGNEGRFRHFGANAQGQVKFGSGLTNLGARIVGGGDFEWADDPDTVADLETNEIGREFPGFLMKLEERRIRGSVRFSVSDGETIREWIEDRFGREYEFSVRQNFREQGDQSFLCVEITTTPAQKLLPVFVEVDCGGGSCVPRPSEIIGRTDASGRAVLSTQIRTEDWVTVTWQLDIGPGRGHSGGMLKSSGGDPALICPAP